MLGPSVSLKEAWGHRLFTIGALWLLLIGLVHSLSLIRNLAPANDTERQLLDLMSSYKFNLVGSMRSMDNLLRGFSITFMLSAFGFSAVAFALRRERTQVLKRVSLVYSLWLAVMTTVSFLYFFPAPTSFLAIALLLFLGATLALPSSPSVA